MRTSKNFLLFVLLSLSLLSWNAGCSQESAQTAALSASQSASVETSPPVNAAGRALPDFTALVDRYGGAVVNIEVVGHRQKFSDFSTAPTEDPFFEFFRRFGFPAPYNEAPAEPPPLRGSASGFIVSSDGYILTNAHVVSNADEVTVRLTDRREFPAKVIGSDTRTDVAVIKIDANCLPIVRIAGHGLGEETILPHFRSPGSPRRGADAVPHLHRANECHHREGRSLAC
jgi:serine protease Do